MAMQILRNHGEFHEGEAVTIRPPSTAIFAVDSDDRYPNYNERRNRPTYPFTFSIAKGESLLNGFFTRLAVSEFRLNWTLPNISSAWGNNQINIGWLAGGVPPPAGATITIPTAFYSIADFCQVFQQLVRAIPGNPLPAFTCTRAQDGTIVCATNTTTTIQFGPIITSVAVANRRQLFDMLSFPPPQVFSAVVTSGIPNMRATDYIDIVSPQLTYNQDLKDGASSTPVRDMLLRVYLDESCKPAAPPNLVNNAAPPITSFPSFTNGDDINGILPFVLYRQYPTPKQVLWNKTQPLGNITFQIYDDQGRSIQDLWQAAFPIGDPNGIGYAFANSFTWNMTLLVTED